MIILIIPIWLKIGMPIISKIFTKTTTIIILIIIIMIFPNLIIVAVRNTVIKRLLK